MIGMMNKNSRVSCDTRLGSHLTSSDASDEEKRMPCPMRLVKFLETVQSIEQYPLDRNDLELGCNGDYMRQAAAT